MEKIAARLRELSLPDGDGAVHLGYKMCIDRRLVTLKITGKTNEHRSGVVDKQHAKFRTSSAMVISIEHADTGETFAEATSLYDRSFVYTLGKEITEVKYDVTPPDIVCGQGIHYFLTRETAFYHDLPYNYSGAALEWRDDGTLASRCTFVNGKHHGLQEWLDEKCVLLARYTCIDGDLDGERETWYPNGTRKSMSTYKIGHRHGSFEHWYENGKPWMKGTYDTDILEGLFEEWTVDGNVHTQRVYKRGQEVPNVV